MLLYWFTFDHGRFGCVMVCGGVYGGLRCCTPNKLVHERTRPHGTRTQVSFPFLLQLHDLEFAFRLVGDFIFLHLAFLNFCLELMYTANCSRRLSLHPTSPSSAISQLSYPSSANAGNLNDEIMFPTSTQLSALIGLATLIGMCCELYILHLFARQNYPGNHVYE